MNISETVVTSVNVGHGKKRVNNVHHLKELTRSL
jgi:hypothetical protein